MGKTASGAVWLDPNKTSPYDFYQYWRNVDDADVLKCIRMLTFLPLEEIEAMDSWEGAQLNKAKEILAYELTALVHGKEEAEKAQTAAKEIFVSGGAAANMPTTTLTDADFTDGQIGVLTLLVKCGLAASNGEARKLVQGGGVSLNGEKVADFKQQLAKDFTVYSIDLPGCGRSDKPNMIYTNYFYVQLLNDFTEKVIKRKTSVAATGLSGSFVIMAANNNENLFDKIFLINPKSINALNQIPNPKSRIAKLLINCPVLGTTLYYILMNRTNVEYNFTETYFHNPFQLSRRTVDIYHECAHRKGNGGKYLLSSIKGNFVNIDISHALKNLDNSIYIIGGASIPGINSIIHGYETLNPAIESALVEKAAYLPQLECPEAFYQTMKVFF